MLVRHLRTFSSLRVPAFRPYFANSVVSMAGVNMQSMARSLLIYRLTGSPALLGIVTVTNFLPLIVLSPIGGALADRFRKKHVVLAGQLLSVIMGLVVAIPLSLGYLSEQNPSSWWVLILAFVLDGICIGLTGPAYGAMVREIVEGDQVMNAVALNGLGQNGLRILAPLLTGVIISAVGFAAAFYIVAGLFVLGTFFVVLIPSFPPQSPPGGPRHPVADIRDGFAYVRREPVLVAVLTFLLVVVLLSMPYGVLLPVFSDDILDVGAAGMGVLISVSGIGATLMSLVLASLPNRKRGLLLLGGTLLLGMALIGFSFSAIWPLSLALIFLVGLGDAVRMTLGNTLLLYYSNQTHWGRVISVQTMVWGLSSVGAVPAGLLGQAIGVQWAIGVFAMVLVLVVLAATAFAPVLRKLE